MEQISCNYHVLVWTIKQEMFREHICLHFVRHKNVEQPYSMRALGHNADMKMNFHKALAKRCQGYQSRRFRNYMTYKAWHFVLNVALK